MKEFMECSDYRELFISYLNGDISADEKNAFDKHLEQCVECRKELEESLRVWNLLAELPVPEPSALMTHGFETMLSGYKKQLVNKDRSLRSRIEDLTGFLAGKLLKQPAFGILLLLVGIMAGYLVHQPAELSISQNRQIDSLSSQIYEMKQLMMLSLLQDQSASRRIQAVSYSDDMKSLDKKVTDALFTTLNEDSNVNVRLATLEALAKMSHNPAVREGLIRSIELQDSPIMQSAIADVMVKLHEKNSVKQLQKLLERKDINQLVKANIEKSIQLLI
jgi:hypothetical protein